VRSLNKPLKVLGHGDVTRSLFIVADAFSKTAIAKIEAAGGTAHVLEFPGQAEPEDEAELAAPTAPAAAAKAEKGAKADKTPRTAPGSKTIPDKASGSDH
jgi:hypothetical protein